LIWFHPTSSDLKKLYHNGNVYARKSASPARLIVDIRVRRLLLEVSEDILKLLDSITLERRIRVPKKGARRLRKTVLIDCADDYLHTLCVDPDPGTVVYTSSEHIHNEPVKIRMLPPVSNLLTVFVRDIHI